MIPQIGTRSDRFVVKWKCSIHLHRLRTREALESIGVDEKEQEKILDTIHSSLQTY